MKTEESPQATGEADLRLEMRVKNNVLWKAIKNKYGSVASLCRKHRKLRKQGGAIGQLIGFKTYPFKSIRTSNANQREYGTEYRTLCLQVAKALKMPVEVLFPIYLYDHLIDVETSKAIEVSSFAALPMATKEIIRNLPAPVDKDALDTAEVMELGIQIEKALRTLTYREREIIKLRYGIGDGHTYTLEEVGRIFKINKERVRQIESKAARKLQEGNVAEFFVGFIKPVSVYRKSFWATPKQCTVDVDAEMYERIKSGLEKMTVVPLEGSWRNLNVEDTLTFIPNEDPTRAITTIVTALHRCPHLKVLLDQFDAMYYFGKSASEALRQLEGTCQRVREGEGSSILGIEMKMIEEIINV